jgi:hypothetical protein
MTAPARAPLEGDRISSAAPLLPDFLAPAAKKFFVGPRWRVLVLVGPVLVKRHEWISAPTAEDAIEHVRAYGYTDAVTYIGEQVEEG